MLIEKWPQRLGILVERTHASSKDKYFTATQALLFLSVRPSTYPPVLPSVHVFFDSSINLLFHCILPWLSWQLLGLMPSHCSAPSWPLERRLHSLSRYTRPPFAITLFSPLLKSLIQSFTCCRIHTLPFSHLSPSLSSPPLTILFLGGLTETGTGNLLTETMWWALLRKFASPVQSIIPTVLRLHLGSMLACNDASPPEKRKPQTNTSWFLQHKRWMHSQTSSF